MYFVVSFFVKCTCVIRKLFFLSEENYTSSMFTKSEKMIEDLATNPNFARLCRCCATEHNLMYDIFHETCTNAQTYHEVIMECANVQLFKDDGLPSLVCHSCVSVLKSFVVFRRKCIESESILKQMRTDASPDEQETLDSGRVKRDESTPDDIGSNDIKTELDDLDENSASEISLALVYDEIKVEDTTVGDNTLDASSPTDRPCPEITRRSTETVCDVKEEIIDDRHVDTDRTDLNRHQRTHTGERPYSCENCERSFSFKRNLDQHRCIHTGEKPYPCDNCERSFTRKSTLDEHRFIHTGEKPYSCDTCERSFSHKRTLDEHRFMHTGEKPYSCDTCEKSFRHKRTLDQHQRTHTGEKPFSCGNCESSFSSKSFLNRHHKRTHMDEKPYSCNTCERSFSRKSTLDRHRRTHTGERPYSCDKCEKSFPSKRNLSTHQYTHTGEKPYSCDKCERSFSTQSNCKRHKYTHVGGKPYS